MAERHLHGQLPALNEEVLSQTGELNQSRQMPLKTGLALLDSLSRSHQNQLHHQPQHQHQIQHQTPNQQIFKNTQIDSNVNQVDKFFENTDYGKKFPPWEKSSFHGKKPTFNETFTIYGQLNFFNGFLDPNMMKLAMMGMGMPLYNMENINMQNPMDMQNFSYPQMNMILNQQQRNTHLNQGSGSMPGIQKNMYKNHN